MTDREPGDASVDELVAAIAGATPPPNVTTKIVAVDGLGGAGKSTLAARLAAALGDAPILQTDDFASWDDPLDWWPRLIAEALEPLARGEPARFRRNDWEGDRELWREVLPAAYVVVEGVSSSRAAFRPFLTYSIWIETPPHVRLERGLARDGVGALAQWQEWMRQEDEYVTRERPHQHADAVLRGDRDHAR